MKTPDVARRARRFAGLLRARAGRLRARAAPVDVGAWRLNSDDAPGLLREADTDLARLFYGHKGRTVDKWIHYFEPYERHFDRFRDVDFGMLEVGVFMGGSLELWRDYFGQHARIMGIDIEPECAKSVDPPNMVRIGSQDDPEFLRSCVDELGSLDLVLDDGSHIGRHQWATFRTLFPLLSDGGVYVIEDLHSSYWPNFEGKYGARDTGIGLVKTLIDDMHAWYHDMPERTDASRWVPAVHVYDSMVFIEKRARERPAHIRVTG